MEWRRTARFGWKELTGVKVKEYPDSAREARRRHYGPSSNYSGHTGGFGSSF
jgi:hypothetical protein